MGKNNNKKQDRYYYVYSADIKDYTYINEYGKVSYGKNDSWHRPTINDVEEALRDIALERKRKAMYMENLFEAEQILLGKLERLKGYSSNRNNTNTTEEETIEQADGTK